MNCHCVRFGALSVTLGADGIGMKRRCFSEKAVNKKMVFFIFVGKNCNFAVPEWNGNWINLKIKEVE